MHTAPSTSGPREEATEAAVAVAEGDMEQTPWSPTALAIIIAAAIFFAGLAVYLLVSFLHLTRFSERRALSSSLKEAGWEALWACVTQPLLPVFYLLGRRMGRGRDGVPVILVHGYMQNRVDFLRVALALRRSGCGPIYAINYPWWQPIRTLSSALGRFVAQVQRETGAAAVDLVCHSMGGVVAVEYVSSGNHDKVRRLITIGSPHAGIPWRGPVLGAGGRELRSTSAFHPNPSHGRPPLPSLVVSIASTHDNVVHPHHTSHLAQRGGHDVLVAHRAHLALLFDREVVGMVTRYITSGELPRMGDGHPPRAA